MNCSSCNRQNADDLSYCDYCGTPLKPAAQEKRRTEFEAPARPAKRVTEFESPSPTAPAAPAAASRIHDPFDPFSTGNPPPAKPNPPVLAKTPVASKQNTVYVPADQATRTAPATPETTTSPAPGRRIIGWAVTFDQHPDGLSFVLLEGRNIVGRDAQSDVRVDFDPTVSGTHAFLIWRLGRARVADANTQNGTFLNEEDVLGQIEVKDGDVIRVGRTRFLVRLIDQEKAGAVWKTSTSTHRSE